MLECIIYIMFLVSNKMAISAHAISMLLEVMVSLYWGLGQHLDQGVV